MVGRANRVIALLIATLVATAASAGTAAASTTQRAIIQDDAQLHANLSGTLTTMRELGASTIRVAMYWSMLAPDARSRQAPRHFNATNPGSYPQQRWAFFDELDREASADGLTVDLMLTGPAPLWATGPGMPHTPNCPCGQWKPSASAFGAFAAAVGHRYNGSYAPNGASAPLPRIGFWSIWNEPNYGPDLAPQALDSNRVDEAATLYRQLVASAWSGLRNTGHRPGPDTILIGETAPRGIAHAGFPGAFSGTVPLRFIRAVYCVGQNGRPLRGASAIVEACPATRAASSRFRAQNPALFSASGFADHPYAQGVAPNTPTYACHVVNVCTDAAHRSDPDYADFPEIGRLESLLDGANRAYGSRTRFSIWNTEYGYWTDPPDRSATISQQTAAAYMNWAEYLSYRQPRVASYSQYLLTDPPGGNFASGLELTNGTPKATYGAFALPLYMPVTTASHAASLEIWGCARAAHVPRGGYGLDSQVEIQFAPRSGGPFETVGTVDVTNPRGYFDVRQPFTSSGTVRLAYSSPAEPTVYSRSVPITVR